MYRRSRIPDALRVGRLPLFTFHNNLTQTNINRIDPKNRGISALSYICVHARDLCCTITQDVIDADDVTTLYVDAVFKKDSLSVVSNLYTQLQFLFRTFHCNVESFHRLKPRLNAQPNRCNSRSTSTTLPEAVSALFLLNNAEVYSTRNFSILVAADPSSEGLTPRSSRHGLVQAFRYDSVASVVPHCDAPVVRSSYMTVFVQPFSQNLAAFQRLSDPQIPGRTPLGRIANQPTSAPGSVQSTNCVQPRTILPAFAAVSMATGMLTMIKTSHYGTQRYHATLLSSTKLAMLLPPRN